jgi:outer membrane protein assembly factor BamD
MAFDVPRARLMAAPLARVLLRACAAILLVSAVGCATGATKVPVGTLEPDKFLWERGTQELNKKHWITSREYFRALIDGYPQSTYRADAKLGVGDTYLGEGTLEANVLAINEFREFLSFYPTHKRAPYAQFKLGMAHFYQMHGAQRDQSETIAAIQELTTFVHRPDSQNSEFLEEGKKRLREAHDRLSESEYGVGFTYFRQKWYPGAIDRFVSVLKADPEYTNRDAVYFYLAQSLLKVNRPAEALPYLDKLVAEFEQSEYLDDAKKLAATVKTEMGKPKSGSTPHVP